MKTATDMIPPIPSPPNDPFTLLLNGVAGWRKSLLSTGVAEESQGSGQMLAAASTHNGSEKTYAKNAQYFSLSLDSGIRGCRWHRLIISTRIPDRTRVLVSTFTSELPLSEDRIAALDDEAWTACGIIRKTDGTENWDGLVRNDAGRYLWLRLIFKGPGSTTPEIFSIHVEYPRISLRRYMPAVYGSDPMGADFTDRFLSLFDTTLRSLESRIDFLYRCFDPLSSPRAEKENSNMDFLSWLASWIGVTLENQWSDEKQRRFLKQAALCYRSRGTRDGLRQLLLFYLDLESGREKPACPDAPIHSVPCCGSTNTIAFQNSTESQPWVPPPLILEHFHLRRWMYLNSGKLGESARLWGRKIVNRSRMDGGARLNRSQLISAKDPHRDPFHHYAHKFSVFLPACFKNSDRRAKALENMIQKEKPAHTQAHVAYVEAKFRIGIQSMIGYDSVVAACNAETVISQTHLGKASIVGEGKRKASPGGGYITGKRSSIGFTPISGRENKRGDE